MRHRRPKSIQTILTYCFFACMLLLCVLASVVFSIIQYHNLQDNLERTIASIGTTVGSSIDLQISQMDTICLNTINSQSIKSTFVEYCANNNQYSYEQIQRARFLANNLAAIKGIDSSIRQINLYGYTTGSFGYGNYTGNLQCNAVSMDWFDDVVQQDGLRYLSAPFAWPMISNGAGTEEDHPYLALYRMYYDTYGNPMGFVEVMKYADILFSAAADPEIVQPMEILVYDSLGNQIYPISTDAHTAFPYLDHTSNRCVQLYNDTANHWEFVSYTPLELSGFTVVTIMDRQAFLEPIYQSIMIIIVVCCLLLLLCVLLSHMLAKRLSAPLKTIYRFLFHMNPSNQFQPLALPDSGVIEIDKLRNSLNEALAFQKSATETMMLMKEQELQAQMLAFQSQMNPHFLYNSLSTVAAMAESGMQEPIVRLCENITSILRYISSNREQTSTLEEELEYCDLYLECMKLRFGEALQYEFDIDDTLLDLPVPKLCIQLLVENAVKFTTRASQPWNISITGQVNDSCWYITVQDSGPGFSPEKHRYLQEQMDKIRRNGLLPSLAIDGMGLLNVFIRFYLLHGQSFLFDFGNPATGGAMVIIGGSLDAKS